MSVQNNKKSVGNGAFSLKQCANGSQTARLHTVVEDRAVVRGGGLWVQTPSPHKLWPKIERKLISLKSVFSLSTPKNQ